FMLFILMYGAKGETVFAAEGYAKKPVEGLGGLAIFEYFIILIPAAYLFAGNNKLYRYLFYTVVALFCFKTLGFGGRNLLIQIAMVFFLFQDGPKLKYRHLIVLAIIPVY